MQRRNQPAAVSYKEVDSDDEGPALSDDDNDEAPARVATAARPRGRRELKEDRPGDTYGAGESPSEV